MTKLTEKNPKLKALVEKFTKAHQTFCNEMVQVAYRLTKEAAQIGDILLDMQEEGSFQTKRRLWIWLELEVNYEIPRTTFYRYINAAEWWKQAEIVHGQEALTDVASLKALKLLASPKVEFDPIDDGWTKKGSNYTRTIQGVHAEVRCEEGKKPYVWINGKCDCATGGLKDAVTIAEEKATRLAQVPPHANGAAKGVKLHAIQEAQEAVIEGGDPDDDPNDEDDEEEKPQQSPQVQPNSTSVPPTGNGTPHQITYFHSDCHNFQIDGNSLQCLDQQGQTVILVAPKKQRMADMLRDALADKPEDPQNRERIEQSKFYASPPPDITNMNPMEIGQTFRKLKRGGMTIPQIADHYRLTQQKIRNHLKLLKLKPEEQQQVAKGTLSLEDGCRRVDRRDAGQEATEKKPATKKPTTKKQRAVK